MNFIMLISPGIVQYSHLSQVTNSLSTYFTPLEIQMSRGQVDNRLIPLPTHALPGHPVSPQQTRALPSNGGLSLRTHALTNKVTSPLQSHALESTVKSSPLQPHALPSNVTTPLQTHALPISVTSPLQIHTLPNRVTSSLLNNVTATFQAFPSSSISSQQNHESFIYSHAVPPICVALNTTNIL